MLDCVNKMPQQLVLMAFVTSADEAAGPTILGEGDFGHIIIAFKTVTYYNESGIGPAETVARGLKRPGKKG